MLAFFPVPYPDELLYSLCARYSRLVDHHNRKTTLHQLFGRTTVTAVPDLPVHLSALADRLSLIGGPTASELIEQHTLLPYFSAFMPADKRADTKEAMLGQGQPHWLLGLMATRVSAPNALRYCPVCANDERQRYGEAYWHRVHQLPGVLVCERHNTLLEDSAIRFPAPTQRHFFWPAETTIPERGLARQITPVTEAALLVELARRTTEILEGTPMNVPVDQLTDHYFAALADRDFATYSGQLRIKELLPAFESFLPNALGLRLGLQSRPDTWLLRLMRKPRTEIHTLHHILVQAFLNLNFLQLASPVQPFGGGPWPCLNRTSQHYGEPVIPQVEISFTSNDRAPIGTFTCTCGFSYRRVGPDRELEARFRLDRMADYGEPWKETLKAGWQNPDLSLRELSRQLGFDPRTVRQQAAYLGLPPERPGSRGAKEPTLRSQKGRTPSAKKQILCYRQQWQRARQQNPDASLKTLRLRHGGVYTWLYRHDRHWLQAHQPPRQTRKANRFRVDWKKRDEALVTRLRQAATDLKRQLPPVRISESRLGREIGESAVLTQHIKKLPHCAKLLADIKESREAFAMRRIQIATDQLMTSNERVSRSQFIRKCGLRAELLLQSDVACVFQSAWNRLQARFEVPAA